MTDNSHAEVDEDLGIRAVADSDPESGETRVHFEDTSTSARTSETATVDSRQEFVQLADLGFERFGALLDDDTDREEALEEALAEADRRVRDV